MFRVPDDLIEAGISAASAPSAPLLGGEPVALAAVEPAADEVAADDVADVAAAAGAEDAGAAAALLAAGAAAELLEPLLVLALLLEQPAMARTAAIAAALRA
jgi:hypothetical protein